MSLCVFLFVILVAELGECAPLEHDNTANVEAPASLDLHDAPQTNEKNQVQEWFESLSKNASTGTQNFMNGLKEWFQKQNPQGGGFEQNLPTMYMGSFQLLKMPMPQISDVLQGMNNFGTAAQTINKLTGGFTQGLPLVPKQ